MTDEQVPAQVSNGRNGPNLTFIFFLILIALAAVFFLQNSEPLALDFLVFEKTTTIRWSLLVAVVLGMLIDRVFSIWWRRRGNRKNN